MKSKIRQGMARVAIGTRTVVLVVLLTMTVNAARADWRVEAETGLLYESNLSNSDRASDEKDDVAWQSKVRLGNGLQLTRDLRLNLSADASEQVWARYDDFNNLLAGGTAGLRYRFGLGGKAPWVLVEDHAAYAFFNDDRRSGLENRFRVRGGVGISERLSAEAGYTFDDFEAKNSFFDLSGHSGSIRLTFDATESLQVALGYNYREGDVISYARPPRPDIATIAAEELESITSFGRPLYTAYRLGGSTNAVSASLGYTLTKNASVLVSYEFRHTASGPLEYENHVVEAKFSFAY